MNRDLFGQVIAEKTSAQAIGRQDHLTFRGNVLSGRHGWLRLTPAYSLHVVRQILESCSDRDLVLDPFSGTGTTALVSAAMGIRCHAVDINPFLVWLGNLKVRRFSENTARSVRCVAERIVFGLRVRDRTERVWVPDIHTIDKWWDTATTHTLAHVFAGIRACAATVDQEVTDLLKIAFCRVMIQNANVTFGHQSMSFKNKDRSERLPLLSDTTPTTTCEDIERAFLQEATELAETLAEDQPTAEAAVFLGDSRNPGALLPRSCYTTVVTSPPYPNRMSYIRELRPYMYWLGYLTSGRQAGELDWHAIGGTWGCATSLLGAWQPPADSEIPYPGFDRIIRTIARDHEILARYVHKYFFDIKEHIEALRMVLAPGAHCHYIVGNSKFYGTLIPVEEIYAAMFEAGGFEQVSIETLRKRTSKKELYEYVVRAINA